VHPKLKSALVALLALTTFAGGVQIWRQRHELAALYKTSTTERAAWEKRLADTERHAHDLQNQLAALKTRVTTENAAAIGIEPATSSAEGTRGRFRGSESFMAMMNDPKVTQLMGNREKLMLDGRYAPLFKELLESGSLNDEQLDAFKNLLVERQNTMRDIMMSARTQGITDRGELSQLAKNAQDELEAQIQSTLGPIGFEQYQQFEKTAPQRNLVKQLAQSLSYTASPLTDEQSQQLTQWLAATTTGSPITPSRPAFGGGPYGGSGGSSVEITDELITRAQAILDPTQLLALMDRQKQQENDKALGRLLRNSSTGPASPPPVKARP